MNQKSIQKAASSVERDFYKLLSSSNFGIDCRNNIDTCFLEPLYDDFSQVSYILRREITQTFTSKIFSLNKDDPTYQSRKKYYERQIAEELDAVDSYQKRKKKGNKV